MCITGVPLAHWGTASLWGSLGLSYGYPHLSKAVGSDFALMLCSSLTSNLGFVKWRCS